MTATAEDRTDGRRARRERGRLAVLDAVIDLLRDGHSTLTAAEVTARSGVSEATLFRYFDTLDQLQHEATTRYFERYAPLFEIPGIGRGTLGSRAHRYAAARVALYEVIAPIARVGRARALEHPHLAETVHRARLRQSSQVREHFGAELAELTPAAGEDLVVLITTITSFESWEQHRHDFRRTPVQIRRAWKRAVLDLCA